MGKDFKGRPPKSFSESTIRNAILHTKSNRQAARYLNTTIDTYKKYASIYVDQETGKTLYELHANASGKGISKNNWKQVQAFGEKLDRILESGDVSATRFEVIKRRIIYEGRIKNECYKCGFAEKRVIDFKQPLILNFKDGNKHNFKIDNLEHLCYNCYFLYVGNLFSDRQIKQIEDVTTPVVKKDVLDWKVDEHFLQHFKELGIMDDNDSYEPGDEFISRI